MEDTTSIRKLISISFVALTLYSSPSFATLYMSGKPGRITPAWITTNPLRQKNQLIISAETINPLDTGNIGFFINRHIAAEVGTFLPPTQYESKTNKENKTNRRNQLVITYIAGKLILLGHQNTELYAKAGGTYGVYRNIIINNPYEVAIEHLSFTEPFYAIGAEIAANKTCLIDGQISYIPKKSLTAFSNTKVEMFIAMFRLSYQTAF